MRMQDKRSRRKEWLALVRNQRSVRNHAYFPFEPDGFARIIKERAVLDIAAMFERRSKLYEALARS